MNSRLLFIFIIRCVSNLGVYFDQTVQRRLFEKMLMGRFLSTVRVKGTESPYVPPFEPS
jgi:hypothetical protein